MKRLSSILLGVIVLASMLVLYLPSAQMADAEVKYTIGIESLKGIYGGTADDTGELSVVTDEGRQVKKLMPLIIGSTGNTLSLNYYSLGIDADALEGVTHMTVEYKYVCPNERHSFDKMQVSMMPHSGALNAWVKGNSMYDIKTNVWQHMVFRLPDFETKIVVGQGKKLQQFMIAPFGPDIDVRTFDDGEYVLIGDVKFWVGDPSDFVGPINESALEAAGADAQKPKPKVEVVFADDPENGIKITGKDTTEGVITTPLFTLSASAVKATYPENTAKLDKYTEDGKELVRVTPAGSAFEGTGNLGLDFHGLKIPAAYLKNVRYIAVNYKYDCPSDKRSAATKMQISITPTSGALNAWHKVNSSNTIKEGEWTRIIFNCVDFENKVEAESGTVLKQFFLTPFGNGVEASTISPEEIFTIGDIEFWTVYPDVEKDYTVNYTCKIGHATGTAPDAVIGSAGKAYTIPENTFIVEGGTFLGWRSSVDGQLYAPGTAAVIPTSSVTYTAEFDYTPIGVPDYISVNFSTYANGIISGHEVAYCSETTFDGKAVYKVVPNTNWNSDAYKKIVIDNYNYSTEKIDLAQYKTMAVMYYIDGTLPKTDSEKGHRIKLGFSKSRGVLADYCAAVSQQELKTGSWQIATFDISHLESHLDPARPDNYLGQIHFDVMQEIHPAAMTEVNAFYYSNLMFFKGTDANLEMHEPYMTGYDGGLFKPTETMTRAEACTIVARLSAGGDGAVPTGLASRFTDVTEGMWFTKYITYVDSLGYLKSFGAEFLPNTPITRAEFVELVYNMGLLADKGLNGSFTDVPADHARATVIAAAGKAGLVNGYANGDGTFRFNPDATITRAEVVKVINNAYGRSVAKDKLSSDVRFLHYDVEDGFWAYSEIAEAVLPHVESNGEWVTALKNPKELLGGDVRIDLAKGEAYLAELEALTNARISEIRSTPSIDTSKLGGKVYYVSSSTGDDSNDGLSPEKAWKTVNKVSRMQSTLKSGDAVLFKRGDIWREDYLVTQTAGVTYSAYGEGAKPELNGSPVYEAKASDWSLLEGTSNIWVYHEDIIDVGVIVFDRKGDKPIWASKESASCIDGKFFKYGTDYTEPFDLIKGLDYDLEFFNDIPTNDFRTVKGKMYLRCDAGNPGEVFDTIELAMNQHIITAGPHNLTFDNLSILMGGAHGISCGTTKGLTVTNCEIGWIGGGVQYYGKGSGIVRFGNGVEIYGGVDGYLIDNCYVYQCYDAGVTHQISEGSEEDIRMDNITYSNNVIEDCIYSIEHFLVEAESGTRLREGKNLLIEGNILRRAGYGFGISRPNGNPATHIQGRSGTNKYAPGTYIVRNNIFDRGTYSLTTTNAADKQYLPKFEGNTFVQIPNLTLAYFNGPAIPYDSVADYSIRLDLGDESAKVYWVDGEKYGFEYHGYKWK